MIYSLDTKNAYISNTILLSYRSASEKFGVCPTLNQIQQATKEHFLQEFSIEVMIHDRAESFGAGNQSEFLEMLQDGEFDDLAPAVSDTKYLLDTLQMSFSENDITENSALQEVW